MPKALHEKLKIRAREKFPIHRDMPRNLKKEIKNRRRRYIYGVLRKTGWSPTHSRRSR